MRRFLKRFLLVLLLVVVALVAWFYLRYGGTGQPFPSRATAPILPDSALQVVARLPEPPGNLAVSKDGRVFFTYHAESQPETKVLELIDGQPVPYPSAEWQRPRGEGQPFFDAIFNVRIDGKNRLWTLDHGFHGTKIPRLLAFDLATNQLVHQFDFPKSSVGWGSYIQDMQVDSTGRYVFIADIGVMAKTPALLVYDSEKKTARRLLVDHPALKAEPYEINAQGRRMYPLPGHLYWMHPEFDPIALDKQNQWLYVGAMSSDKLFRVRMADVLNEALPAEDLGRRVELYANRSQCDGLTMDRTGNIYVTSIEDGAINVIGTDRKQRTLVKHPKMRWPDGLSFGPGGWLYVADSDIPDVMMQSKDHIRASAPFYIFRFKPGTVGVPGQ